FCVFLPHFKHFTTSILTLLFIDTTSSYLTLSFLPYYLHLIPPLNFTISLIFITSSFTSGGTSFKYSRLVPFNVSILGFSLSGNTPYPKLLFVSPPETSSPFHSFSFIISSF